MNTTTIPAAKILIVDDESYVRGLLTAILSDKYNCTEADSAEAALACLEAQTFDVVISDNNMGGMSGIELLAHIGKLAPDTVIMMISGNQSIDTPIDAIRSGAFDYLKKPFELDQVEIAVDRAVAHRQLLVAKRRHEEELELLVAERTERLNYLAYHDTITGLSNRTFFEEKLVRSLQKGGHSDVAVMLVSLDRFEGLRDTLGHSFTDLLLREVGARLTDAAGIPAVKARFEGAEFAILVNNTDTAALDSIANAVCEAIRPPFSLGGYDIVIEVSTGISRTPDDGTDAGELIKHAGAALSHARKLGGGNHQFYTSGIHEQAIKRLELENDMRGAIDRGEFVLHYQPKVNIRLGTITGMEALIRWQHPRLGLVPPLDFIPLAEETGLIVPMGEWILRTACQQAKAWGDAGFDLIVAVNLSPRQFQHHDLAGRINAIVKETGIDPGTLNLEVTESSIMRNATQAVEAIAGLRRTGIKISIDDFGTGYSSLGVLKDLPIDVLKIDKTFVNDVSTNADDAALVTAVVSLAHDLRLKVVAEGVETEEQLAFLRQVRCDEWQGYLFSKPLPPNDFELLLRSA